jgi:hypothetical protein
MTEAKPWTVPMIFKRGALSYFAYSIGELKSCGLIVFGHYLVMECIISGFTSLDGNLHLAEYKPLLFFGLSGGKLNSRKWIDDLSRIHLVRYGYHDQQQSGQ